MKHLTRNEMGWLVLRLTLACLIAVHGYYRLLTEGSGGFGEWLVSQGIPFGYPLAWAITLTEVAGSMLLAVGRLVLPAALVLSTIYATGIALVHAPNGWFVVGAGRNGVEYSVLLIVALLCVGLQHPLRTRSVKTG
jgi:putative oxidoreductase